MLGNLYDIYEQEDLPEADMYTHLPKWISFLENQLLGRKLEPDDYIFPYVAPNGIAHPKCAMSYDTLQNLLTEFGTGAGLTKHYTTYCFCRGGAQYRFMYAPLGKCWSLSIIHWWGGWATGESVSDGPSLS